MCIAFAAFAANAADLFVSASGTWRPDGYEGTCYTDLLSAINAARSGDTVWLQDGYVCDSGLYESTPGGGPASTGTNGGYVRAHIKQAIVLRSESGYVDEATGKGATIRGAAPRAYRRRDCGAAGGTARPRLHDGVRRALRRRRPAARRRSRPDHWFRRPFAHTGLHQVQPATRR
ncbi:MAG: hypothetical protein IJQ73_01550 [Kiritimatiellae bacterium]|nr:hypothetical protein [Kiritimatiellia bacterium]